MSGTTIVTQTCPDPAQAEAFAAWQRDTSQAIAAFAGFVRQTVLPPSPPAQVDWVILQHFSDRDSAMAWLQSDVRAQRLAAVRPLVTGRDDVHLVAGDGRSGEPVSAVISTRVKPGQEAPFRQWEQRMAATQARAPGFQGYRLEPPVPGVQEDWLSILKFEDSAQLQAWLASPERARMIAESKPFTEEFHVRLARTGFDQWFAVGGTAAGGPAAWKQNMLVLLLLYPVVFLFGAWVATPLLVKRLSLPFPVALFIANVVSIILLNYLVPWLSQRFAWWLAPAAGPWSRPALAGTAIMVAGYAILVAAFTLLF